jgi:putative PIN family toxin of toxin-antitoxin system
VRVVLDTNVLLSALMTRGTPPNVLYEMWRDRRFDLASCELQLVELREVSRREPLKARLRGADVGTLVNLIRRLAMMCDSLPEVSDSPDPKDNYLLAVAQVARAELLVTGDKGHLLSLRKHRTTRIVTARQAVQLMRPGH